MIGKTANQGSIWTIAECHEGALKAVSFEILSRGRTLSDTLGVRLCSIVIGDGIGESAFEELIQRGADDVYSVQDARLRNFICENHGKILQSLAATYKPCIILAAATSSGRTLMPWLAVRLMTGLTADCTELDIEEGTGNLLQTRPAIGGNIMATIKTPERRPQMATVRPKSSRPLPKDASRTGSIIVVPVTDSMFDPRVTVRGYRKDAVDFVNVEEADIVVAGGKGMKKAGNFAMIGELAASLGGVVGASRDAVDRGWIGYPHQIGLSGKTISPKLYIGVGISGAIQHLAGIKTSEVIVSINPDPEANLNKIADFAVVGDAFLVLPALRRRIEELKRERHA